MELQERLELIDQLKTDEHMKLLLAGIKAIGGLDKLSRDLCKQHKAKNETINKKIRQYSGNLVDEFETISNGFYESAVKEVVEFFGSSYEDDDEVTTYVFNYGRGRYDIDSLIIKLKDLYIEIDQISEGYVGLSADNGKVVCVPEHEFDAVFSENRKEK
ncbi:hypothetical protein P4U03_29445 [Bacillus mycoides]|uniref:Uncharacterized protein n=1 Tax=Bacillus thuringiensis serovar navarrensis TaxID=339658 RepID=A0A243ACZ3_BACTU|nr:MULTISPECIES: hypothetical protein [Bacillus cereus group]MED1270598.1 hypothetical protein [Bacillus mycoides]OTY17011.1 hypothetical protein BK732_13320 [Bacillus thuringiensis serovar navarrensis]